MTSIDDLLRNWRKQKQLTQQEAADYFGVSQTTYHNWEACKAQPHFKHLLSICKVCHVEVNIFMKPESPPLPVVENNTPPQTPDQWETMRLEIENLKSQINQLKPKNE